MSACFGFDDVLASLVVVVSDDCVVGYDTKAFANRLLAAKESFGAAA